MNDIKSIELTFKLLEYFNDNYYSYLINILLNYNDLEG